METKKCFKYGTSLRCGRNVFKEEMNEYDLMFALNFSNSNSDKMSNTIFVDVTICHIL